MNKIILLAAFILASCASKSPNTRIEDVRDAAKRGNGDIESGLYSNAETGDNLLVQSQSLRSRIIETQEENRKLDDAIHEQRLAGKTLTQEANVLEARKAQVENKTRSVANVKNRSVHKVVTTTEETEE